ncbi:hypothetical protein Len3610_18025 [Lentibacillus sp. CBA3610]|nr:hypothetical protein Len3610_18025 [Lentibacillus sp. CBA3610]
MHLLCKCRMKKCQVMHFINNYLIKCGGDVHVMRQIPEIEVLIRETDVMVDAILGIGTTGMLRQPLNEIVTRINQADAYVIFN